TLGVHAVLVLHVEDMLGGAAPPFLSGVIMGLPGIALFLSATRWVRLLDRHPLERVTLVAFIGAGVGYIVSGLLPTITLFVPVFFVACVFVAAFRPLGAAVVTMDIDEEFRGRAFGLQTSATTAGGLVGPLLAGAVGDVLGRGAVF